MQYGIVSRRYLIGTADFEFVYDHSTHSVKPVSEDFSEKREWPVSTYVESKTEFMGASHYNVSENYGSTIKAQTSLSPGILSFTVEQQIEK